MAHATSELPPEIASLIEQKRLEDLEDVWTRRMEQDPGDLPFFFRVAAAVKKKAGAEGAEQALSWLRFLADYQGEREDPGARIEVLAEIVRMNPTDAGARVDLEAALKDRYRDHPVLAAVMAQNPIAAAGDPSETARRVSRWLRFSPGEIYFLAGRGAGRIAEMNPALDVIRLDVGGARVPLSLVSAEKNLEPLPAGHFLREKVENPDGLRELASKEPAEAVRRLVASFGGRPLTVGEVREHFSGIVEDARWSSFWTSARKHPQLLVAGASKGAHVSWSASADEAEETVRRDFEAADPHKKLEMARKHAKRSRELAHLFSRSLAAEARRAADSEDAGLAWELSQAAVRLAPDEPEAFGADALLEGADVGTVLAGIRDHVAREKALQEVRARREDWPAIFAARFLEEEDARVLSAIFDALGEDRTRRDDLVRRVMRSPRIAPRAFVWLSERFGADASPEVPPAALFHSLVDALRQDEFGSVRARVKTFFDPGGLAVELVRRASSEEEARDLLNTLTRAGGLEEHRRGTVREALLMRFPALRAPAASYLYATPEAIEARRAELAQLKQVELPANAEQMRAAKEHGDLSENFEYHAARQKHEYLSARIAKLVDELSRTRALESSRIDTSEVRVGTRVLLREPETGRERTATILGPWDSRPEEAVYSYESDFASALLGKRAGERVTLPDGEVEVVSIAAWR